MSILPINLDDLIHARSVENVRLEFKKTFDDYTLESAVHTICAFANDLANLNGGYIVFGIDEVEGRAVLPPHGLDALDMDDAQKRIRGQCDRIDPVHQPVLSPEIYQNKRILVVWAPAGDARPYRAPKSSKAGERVYYVRQGSQTVEPKGDILTQLMQTTARIPFDDRRNLAVSIDTISPSLVRGFLTDIKSDLVSNGSSVSDSDLNKRLRITAPVNAHDAPRNVALLFFTNDPDQYFPGARIEVVQFGDDSGGDLMEEKVFRGPLHDQIRQTLNYLNGVSTTMVRKIPGVAEVQRTVAFPYESMEEAVVNAIYHRSYEGEYEPTKVYLYPDRMEIISYPGPVPGIELRHLQARASIPPVPARNRRIGEFLKELHLAEGRGTGILRIRRKMSENGSPEPGFDFDEARTYFRVTLPAHPQYVVIHALRESAHLWAVGERQRAIANLESAFSKVPTSGAIIAQVIDYKMTLGDLAGAEQLFRIVEKDRAISDRHLFYAAMARGFLDMGDAESAKRVLEYAPLSAQRDEAVEMAILQKRAGRLQQAHRIFAANYDAIKDDAKAVHEFAQTKMGLAAMQKRSRNRRASDTSKHLNREATELLRRAIPLSDSDTRRAWCWFDLAKNLAWTDAANSEVEQAYKRAIELLPTEHRFEEAYHQWRQRIERSRSQQ
jgi:ATP-dependent DNA helicase RecG